MLDFDQALHKIAHTTQKNRVYHDNNFIYEMGARPLPMRYQMNKILNICVNNDTLCLAKSQIIDYSLLVIINTETKKLRFGIIDYVQHYTLEKILESRIKKILKGNEPTIIEPEKYKRRFKKAIKKYFIAMCIQNEKAVRGSRQIEVMPNAVEQVLPGNAPIYQEVQASRAPHQLPVAKLEEGKRSNPNEISEALADREAGAPDGNQ